MEARRQEGPEIGGLRRWEGLGTKRIKEVGGIGEKKDQGGGGNQRGKRDWELNGWIKKQEGLRR